MNALRAMRAAFSYFTILPVGTDDVGPSAVAVAWLPFVGAVIGFVAGSIGLAVSAIAPHAHALAVATAFGATIVLSGAVHVDGFLDACDALFASATPERRLEILRDPTHGTFAVAGFAVVAALWLAALWSIPMTMLPLALALSGAAARWSAAIHALWLAYGRSEPTRAFARRPPVVILALGAVLVIILAHALGWRGYAAVFAPLAAAAVAILWSRARLGGGVTGDAYGFAIVVAEVAALVAVAA